MPRILGTILLMIFLLAGCGSKEPDVPAREGYAVDVGEPIATPTLPPAPPPVTPPTVASPASAEVTVDLLNVRAGPSADTELLGQVKQGDALPILGRDDTGDWLRVQLPDGQAGWVSAQYVRVDADVAPSATPATAETVPAGVIPANAIPAQLLDVVDGETIKVSLAGASEELRYIGIDTPERGQPGFGAATRANRDLLTTTLYLVADQSDRDSNGRSLRYVYTDAGLMVNAELVRQGWAQPAEVPPDTAHAAAFRALAGEAAGSGRGFWGGVGADGAPVYALTQGNTNMREGPGTDFALTSTEPDGTPLLVIGRTRDGEWLQVRAPDRSGGWVAAKLVALAVEVDAAPVVDTAN